MTGGFKLKSKMEYQKPTQDRRIVCIVFSHYRKADAVTVSTIRAILAASVAEYGPDFWVISLDLASSVGVELKNLCQEMNISVAEYSVRLHRGMGSCGSMGLFYRARHASLVDIGDVYHIFGSLKRAADIEDLVERLKKSEKPYAVYGLEGDIVEAY